MAHEQFTKLGLEIVLAVMLFLFLDVFDDLTGLRLADRKCSVPGLPSERFELRAFLLDPDRRYPFQFLDPLGQCDRSRFACQQVNVIFDTANNDGRTIQGVRCASEFGVHLISDVWVFEKRGTVFGRENDMNQDV